MREAWAGRGVRNVWALAHQRRVFFILREGNDEDALYDINNAIRIDQDWGAIAKAKAEQLKEKHGKLLGPPSEMKTTRTLFQWSSQPDDR
jgi:hypothetical protein